MGPILYYTNIFSYISSQRVQLRRERGTLPETAHESALLSQCLLHWPIYAASHMHTDQSANVSFAAASHLHTGQSLNVSSAAASHLHAGQTSSVFSSILPGSVLNPILGGSPVISSI